VAEPGCGDTPLPRRLFLGSKPGAPTPLYVLCKITHGFPCDRAPIAASKRSLGLIDRRKNFRASALAFFPEGKSFLHRIFFAQKPPALNSLADKRPLVGCQTHFHVRSVRAMKAGVKHSPPEVPPRANSLSRLMDP
jgi:hypothetical protein